MDRRRILDLHYEKNKHIFDDLIKFLKSNDTIVNSFFNKTTKDLVASCKTPFEILYKIFLDSIQASGGSNLTSTGEGCQQFLNLFKNDYANNRLSFNEYCNNFKIKISTIDFFNFISNGRIKNFREKKASLFMKSIFYLQDKDNKLIFYDLEQKDIHKPIPVDIVICEFLNIILKIDFNDRLKPSKDFKLINTWAKERLKDNYYLIENLWFWGYFNSHNNKNNYYREIRFNNDKYITNPWFFPDQNLELFNKFKEFREIFSLNAK